MQILTQSRRLRGAIRSVRTRIPTRDWDVITSVVRRIWSVREWQTAGIADRADHRSAGVYEFFGPEFGRIPPVDAQAKLCHICFVLPVCRLYSDQALRGVLAHEFAHAFRVAAMGPGWHQRMQRQWKAEERKANEIAAAWGFGSELHIMLNERKERVDPLIESKSDEIVKRAAKRMERQETEASKRYPWAHGKTPASA